MINCGFQIIENHDRFLPYTMVNQREYPQFLLWLHRKLRPAWQCRSIYPLGFRGG